MANTTKTERAARPAPKDDRPGQRITREHDTLLRQLAEKSGRTRQAIVNDALDVGTGLVLLHQHDPAAARLIMRTIQVEITRCFAAAATAPTASES